MKTVALDAMGGDDAPRVEIEGALAAAGSGQVRVVLVGDQARLEPEIQRLGGMAGLPLEIRHCSQVIAMQDHPSSAVRRKTDSSMRVAHDLVRDGAADAVVSAGNSGAMMACGLFVLKRLRGVDRPAIAATFPTRRGQAVLLDMGANVDCRPLNLVQFGMMGAAFSRVVHGKQRPVVGVLSNGAEEHKGTELTRQTHQLLQGCRSEHFEYRGYVEGRDIFGGEVDVVVCDGFTGNLVLKVTEGAAETLAGFVKDSIKASLVSRLFAVGLLPAFRRVKARMDYAEQGGAPLLGVQGVSIVCHGKSSARAIKNALIGAGRLADFDLLTRMQQLLAEQGEVMAAARGQATTSSVASSSPASSPESSSPDPAPSEAERV